LEDAPLEIFPDHAEGREDVREDVKDHEKPDAPGGCPHMVSLDTIGSYTSNLPLHLPLPAHSDSYVDVVCRNEEEAESEVEAKIEAVHDRDVSRTHVVSHVPSMLQQCGICHTALCHICLEITEMHAYS
jgi:hypothetical protein